MSTSHGSSGRPDAFRELMAQAQATGRPELAHQSLGRPLTEAEQNLAAALMEIYAEGATEVAELAAALKERRVSRPSAIAVDWTPENLAAELRALNASLDASYAENGFGA